MVEVTLKFKSDTSRKEWIELLGKDGYVPVEDMIKTLAGENSMCRISSYLRPISFEAPEISIDLEIKTLDNYGKD